jgi:glycosyltransferase involved in cell wall biosynthesis
VVCSETRLDTLVIVPAYNEADTVGAVVRSACVLGYSVCVVDDGSTDGTADTARRAGAAVLRHSGRKGRGAALRSGFAYARGHEYERAVTVDADGQHNVADIAALVHALESERADLVVGSRFTHPAGAYRIPAGRRLGMRLVTRRAASITGAAITDSTSGFCAVGRPLLDRFASSFPDGFLLDTAGVLVSAHLAGWRVIEAPVRMEPRRAGRSKTGPFTSFVSLVGILLRLTNLRETSDAVLPYPQDVKTAQSPIVGIGGAA